MSTDAAAIAQQMMIALSAIDRPNPLALPTAPVETNRRFTRQDELRSRETFHAFLKANAQAKPI